MSQLIKLAGNTYLFPGPTNIGVFVTNNKCVIIDTGTKSTARALLSQLTQRKIKPEIIINTHHHLGHCEGNSILQEAEGIDIFPEYDGRTDSARAELLWEDTFNRSNLKIIQLPGHTYNHIGVLTPDKVLFTGDAFCDFSLTTDFCPPYFENVLNALTTLRYLWLSKYKLYVTGHGGIKENITKIILQNVSMVEFTLHKIIIILREQHRSYEEVYKILSGFSKIGALKSSFSFFPYFIHLQKSGIISSGINEYNLVPNCEDG